jgi:hypothetical protein
VGNPRPARAGEWFCRRGSLLASRSVAPIVREIMGRQGLLLHGDVSQEPLPELGIDLRVDGPIIAYGPSEQVVEAGVVGGEEGLDGAGHESLGDKATFGSVPHLIRAHRRSWRK